VTFGAAGTAPPVCWSAAFPLTTPSGPLARLLVRRNPAWALKIATTLIAQRKYLARATAWAMAPDAVRRYMAALNAAPAAVVVGNVAGLAPGLRHLRPQGPRAFTFDRRAFKDETVDRIGAALTRAVEERLSARGMLRLAEALVTAAVEAHLEAAAPLRGTEAWVAAVGRGLDDETHGWQATIRRHFEALPQALAPVVWPTLGVDGLGVLDLERRLGLRGEAPRAGRG